MTGKNGVAMWTGLEPGAYVLEEVDPADGYSIINSSETVYLVDSGEQSVITVRFDNMPEPFLCRQRIDPVLHLLSAVSANDKMKENAEEKM